MAPAGGDEPGAADPTVEMDATTPLADAGPQGPSVLRGVVTAAVSGTPVEGASVEVADADGQVVGRAVTVADGRFSTAQLPPGSYRLKVTQEGYLAGHHDHVHPGGRVQIELEQARITGTVTAQDDGPGEHVVAEVTAQDADGHIRARTWTDGSGRFALDGLTAGSYTVAAASDGFFTTREEVQLDAGLTPLALELVPAELQGQVLTESNSEPVLDAQAKLRTPDGRLVGQSVTDPAGRFLIPLADLAPPAAVPGTTHHLEVSANGFEPTTVELSLSDEPAAEVTVALAAAKRSPWVWAGIGAALLAILAALFALFSTDETVVPDLVGVTIEEAADLLEAEELALGEVTFTDTDPDAEPGTVLSSDPEAGETVDVGDAVDLTAADDPAEDPTVEVPRVTGRQESDALRLLDALGFDVVISRVEAEEPAGLVVAQDPAPRTEVPVGDEVRIDISEGPGEAAPEPEPEPEPENGLPDIDLPEIDTDGIAGFFERVIEWLRGLFDR
ncbi:MAG: PASTA domain-containing protein [Nitriliruptor sp.]|nr:MAG: PASTA domain-containing protein [Nitriliruptor sp.]